jgi:hypothetical protein
MFINLSNQNRLLILKIPDYYPFNSLLSLFDSRF